MKKYKKVLEQYLNSPMSQALFINGKWGCGKTHYFREEFKQDCKVKGNVIYTSVNGVKSIDELKIQVFITQAKTSKKGFWKSTKEKAMLMSHVYLKNLGFTIFDLFEIGKDDVLIIDDLERKHTDLTIEEIFGFVSVHFTENLNHKVILVADEEKLKSGDDSGYLTIKEKTVWRTIPFDSDIKEILKSIANNYDTDFSLYITARVDLIVGLMKEYNISNLRTILFFLSVLQDIHKNYSTFLEDEDKKNVLLNTLLIYSNHYKETGTLIDTNSNVEKYLLGEKAVFQNTLQKSEEFIIHEFEQTDIGDDSTVEDETYEESFAYTYFQDPKTQFSPSKEICLLIENGIFNKEHMDEDINKVRDLYDASKDWILILAKFSNPRERESKDELDKVTDQLFDYIKDGKYSLNELTTIAHMFEMWITVGIPYKINKKELYQLLNNQISKEHELGKGYNYYPQESEAKSKGYSDEYCQFIESVEIEFTKVASENRKEYIDKLLDNYSETATLNGEILADINSSEEKDHEKRMVKLITKSNLHLLNYEKSYWKALHRSIAFGDSTKIRPIYEQQLDNVKELVKKDMLMLSIFNHMETALRNKVTAK